MFFMLLHIDMVYTHALCPYARKSTTQNNNPRNRVMRRREGDYRGWGGRIKKWKRKEKKKDAEVGFFLNIHNKNVTNSSV